MESTYQQKLVRYWRNGSRRSLRLARDVFARKYYDHAVFCAHLALEKLLKSMVVERAARHAPHSHDLLYLAGLAKIELDTEQQQAFAEINAFNIEGRYQEEKLEFHRRITKAHAERWLKAIEVLYLWLSKQSKKS